MVWCGKLQLICTKNCLEFMNVFSFPFIKVIKNIVGILFLYKIGTRSMLLQVIILNKYKMCKSINRPIVSIHLSGYQKDCIFHSLNRLTDLYFSSFPISKLTGLLSDCEKYSNTDHS